VKSKGFTLIELLVVISIIALLSSIVLSSLNSARTKGSDNAVKAAMKQLAIQAENYRDTAANFGTNLAVCTSGVFNDARIAEIKTNILANAASGATLACSTSANGFLWALSVNALKGGGGWCIDNSSKFKAATTNTGGLCP
jgi:prepilin-type N-terminal cleavage/methylation domain-containing protein